ncbi:hypothetical protein D3C76_807270 [compost metagenome]
MRAEALLHPQPQLRLAAHLRMALQSLLHFSSFMPGTAHRNLDRVAAAGDWLNFVVFDMAQLRPEFGHTPKLSHVLGILRLFLRSELQPIREII